MLSALVLLATQFPLHTTSDARNDIAVPLRFSPQALKLNALSLTIAVEVNDMKYKAPPSYSSA